MTLTSVYSVAPSVVRLTDEKVKVDVMGVGVSEPNFMGVFRAARRRGGEHGDRTRDIQLAKLALSHLS